MNCVLFVIVFLVLVAISWVILDYMATEEPHRGYIRGEGKFGPWCQSLDPRDERG